MPVNIDHLTEAQLVDLHNRVVARLKILGQIKDHAAMLNFRIGEQVSFQPPGRGVLTGILAKYNQKTVTVITPEGQQWHVSPGYLLKVDGGLHSGDMPMAAKPPK
jgi:hypothetical protein